MKDMTKFSIRFGDLEVRSCNSLLMADVPHVRAELVKWDVSKRNNKEYCFTLGYWKRDSEGYTFRFVEDRPLEYIEDWNIFRDLVKPGQTKLDEYFEETEEE